jgi:hypothetical protein
MFASFEPWTFAAEHGGLDQPEFFPLAVALRSSVCFRELIVLIVGPGHAINNKTIRGLEYMD